MPRYEYLVAERDVLEHKMDMYFFGKLKLTGEEVRELYDAYAEVNQKITKWKEENLKS